MQRWVGKEWIDVDNTLVAKLTEKGFAWDQNNEFNLLHKVLLLSFFIILYNLHNLSLQEITESSVHEAKMNHINICCGISIFFSSWSCFVSFLCHFQGDFLKRWHKFHCFEECLIHNLISFPCLVGWFQVLAASHSALSCALLWALSKMFSLQSHCCLLSVVSLGYNCQALFCS